jgi:hypothetical protein
VPRASADQHLQAAQYCLQAFRAVYGRDPSRDELRYALCEALHDTTYGRRWKPPGTGSFNIGAIQAGKSWSGETFEHTDHHSDGTPYQIEFRKYSSPEEGWLDYIRVLYQQRSAVLRAVQAPNEIYRVAQANVTQEMTELSVKLLKEFYPRIGASRTFYASDFDRYCVAVLEPHSEGKTGISLAWVSDKPRAFASAMISTRYYESFGSTLEERIASATTAMLAALNEIDAVPVIPLDLSTAPTAPELSTSHVPNLDARWFALAAVAVGVGFLAYKGAKQWQAIRSAGQELP